MNGEFSMVISFFVGEEEFVADGSHVVSVLPIQSVALGEGLTFDLVVNLPTDVPATEVVDMHDILKVPRREIGAQSRFLIVESNERRVAFLVDRVTSIATAEEDGLAHMEYKSVKTMGDAVIREAEGEEKLVQVMDFDQLVKDKLARSSNPKNL